MSKCHIPIEKKYIFTYYFEIPLSTVMYENQFFHSMTYLVQIFIEKCSVHKPLFVGNNTIVWNNSNLNSICGQ